MALLESKTCEMPKRDLWSFLHNLKTQLYSPTSVYAAKTAAAATLYALLIFIEGSRQWFISYGMTGGLLTVVVALAPTLG